MAKNLIFSAVWLVPTAYVLDLLIGDPVWITHPVVLIGKLISCLERLTYHQAKSGTAKKLAGALTAGVTVGGSYIITYALVAAAAWLHPWLGICLNVWLISTTIAGKGLARAACTVLTALTAGDIARARKRVGMIVGRDTDALDSREVTRATVETVAENTVDGITAPIFYALLGGAPLAMAYRAVNTLDSMLGYKNERYADFGWASARLDDLANYLPARLTGLLLPVAAWLIRLSPSGAVKVMPRDAAKHPSPNSGIMEAGFAGAMGVTLGGRNFYGRVESFRALLGEGGRPLVADDIYVSVRLMQVISALFLAVNFGLGMLFLEAVTNLTP